MIEGQPGSQTGSNDVARDPVLARLQPRWSATRTEDNLAVAFQRIEGTRRLRRLSAAGALTLGALALVFGWTTRRPAALLASRAPEVSGPSAPRVLSLPDGSNVALVDAGARVALARTSPERIEVALAGSASFEVPPRKGRTVVVKVTRFEVAILAAKFELAPVGERLKVTVLDGDVAVSWPGGQATVKSGDAALLPADVTALAEGPAEAPRARLGTAEQRSRFRSLVAHRDYAGAYRSLVAAPDVAEHSAEDLMLAADAARLSGHPASAVPYLRRLLRDYPADVRGPVAAFTLGRVLLAELSRPAEAADAFAISYRLAPAGPLAADALGREVEAAARAGDAARARRLAATYVARYPNEPRAAAVRRAGRLD
jgi:transmembrane sensor